MFKTIFLKKYSTLIQKGISDNLNLSMVSTLVPLFLFSIYHIDHDGIPTSLDSSITNTIDKVSIVPSEFNPSNHHTGIDISHYQGDLLEHISKHNSLDFIICKATEGITYIDKDFKKNWAEIRNRKLIRGTYHFYIATDDPIKQAQHFFNTVGSLSDSDMAPIIDVEALGVPRSISPQSLQTDLKIFIERVQKNFGRQPIIYSNYDFAQEYLTQEWLADYPLWIAEYSAASAPKIPDAWRNTGYKIWQKSDHYSVDSIQTDLDLFIGHKSDLTN